MFFVSLETKGYVLKFKLQWLSKEQKEIIVHCISHLLCLNVKFFTHTNFTFRYYCSSPDSSAQEDIQACCGWLHQVLQQ